MAVGFSFPPLCPSFPPFCCSLLGPASSSSSPSLDGSRRSLQQQREISLPVNSSAVSARRVEQNRFLKMRRQSRANVVPDGRGWVQGGCRAAPHCCLLQHCTQCRIPPTPGAAQASHSREQQDCTNPNLLKHHSGGNIYYIAAITRSLPMEYGPMLELFGPHSILLSSSPSKKSSWRSALPRKPAKQTALRLLQAEQGTESPVAQPLKVLFLSWAFKSF